MSHFTVLVVGNDWEKQLDPFWELDLSFEELKNDYRAKFNSRLTKEEAIIELEKSNKEYPEDEPFTIEAWADENGYIFDEESQTYGYLSNPNAKWDWYQMGGRWSGFFKLKPVVSRKVLGKSGAFDNSPKFDSDQALKCEIDIDGMRDSAVKEHEKYYDEFHAILAGRSIPNWEEILSKYSKEKINLAREEYGNNPVIKELREKRFWDFEQYLIDKEKYLKIAKESVLSTYAILKDGIWYERGQMGWWGMASNEKDKDIWNEEFTKLFESLPDDTLLTIVDCHI